MKITVYTITDCQFSKQEKEYLTSHQLQYEEKNLETNKDFLTEMLAVSNNFAGTPVTKIEKDDGKIEVLKGFTKEEFDTTLGFAAPTDQATKQLNNQATPPPTSNPQPSIVPPAPPVTPEPPKEPEKPVVPPTNQATKQPNNQVTNPPTANPQSPTTSTEDPLNSILADLQTKSAEPIPTDPTGSTDSTATAPPLPNVPDFQDKI